MTLNGSANQNADASFVAIDVETANVSRASICQIGAVRVARGSIADTFNTLVDPETWFDPFNVELHGISAATVRGKPKFSQIAETLATFVGDRIVISHTSFDRSAFEQSYRRYSLEKPMWTWLDTARVARRAWTGHAGGYGLHTLASSRGIAYRRHEAAEDARAAAEILMLAIADSGLGLFAWLERVRKPVNWDPSVRSIDGISQDGNPEGPLHGEVIVFTGTLSIPRRMAAKRAADLGCDVRNTVNSTTTMLVVGLQDTERLSGYEKSSKHRMAEKLISAGANVVILDEDDFFSLG